MPNHPSDAAWTCGYKLALLSDLFTHDHPDCQITLTREGQEGLAILLHELWAELRDAAGAMTKQTEREV